MFTYIHRLGLEDSEPNRKTTSPWASSLTQCIGFLYLPAPIKVWAGNGCYLHQ
uniref:Uncharacterized protein n=1 Tax=Rhizophora mucronata TaxID=61149 RepID=A0A2P2IKH2_RHIMU